MLQYYYLTRRYQINNLARWCQFFGVWGVGRILQNQNSYVIILHNFIRYRSVQLDLMSMTVWPCARLPLKKHQRKTLLILHRKISRFLTFLPQNYCEFTAIEIYPSHGSRQWRGNTLREEWGRGAMREEGWRYWILRERRHSPTEYAGGKGNGQMRWGGGNTLRRWRAETERRREDTLRGLGAEANISR